MKPNEKGTSIVLSEDAIQELFKRFCQPIVLPCITPAQEERAVGIAKILWLRLVTGTDTEKIISEDLKKVTANNRDANVALGSLYFFKMKPALSGAEVGQLREHYADDRNFERLEEWAP